MIEIESEIEAHVSGRRRETGGIALAFPVGADRGETALVFVQADGDADDVRPLEHLVEQGARAMLVRHADPSPVAESLSRIVGTHLEGRQHPKLSLVLGMIDHATAELRYVNLDHRGAYRRTGAGALEPLATSTRRDLGEATRAPLQRLALEPGDRLVFTSAAITDRDVLDELEHEHVDETATTILEAAEEAGALPPAIAMSIAIRRAEQC